MGEVNITAHFAIFGLIPNKNNCEKPSIEDLLLSFREGS